MFGFSCPYSDIPLCGRQVLFFVWTVETEGLDQQRAWLILQTSSLQSLCPICCGYYSLLGSLPQLFLPLTGFSADSAWKTSSLV